MDVVYLCRSGDNPELMYSLRSLVNIPHDQVWIFGDAPAWVNTYKVGVIRVPRAGNKHRHTNETMRTACSFPAVSDSFVLMNDDFYITKPIKRIPTLNLGTIQHVIDSYTRQGFGHAQYVAGMRRTKNLLEGLGYNAPLSFEAHTPMVIRKPTMLEALGHGPYQRRTVYGNLAGLNGKSIRDVKLTSTDQPLPPGPFLSTSDTTFRGAARDKLHELFPTPGPYEFT